MIVKKEGDVGALFFDHCSGPFHRSKDNRILPYFWHKYITGCIYAKNAVENGMRISVNCCWNKTCNQQNKWFCLWGKLILSYICRISHPYPAIRDSEPRCVAGIEVLPEHHKPLREASLSGKENLVLLVLQTSRSSRFSKSDQSWVHTPRNRSPPAHSGGSRSSSLPVKKIIITF